MRKVLFLYNPISGRRQDRREQSVRTAVEVFRHAGLTAEMQQTSGPGTAAQQAHAAADAGFDAVIVCGGDGSVHEALQGLVDRDTALGVLPLGTGNALATDLGIPRQPARAAERLLASQPRAVRLPRMEFATPVANRSERSCYFLVGAGVGADAQMMYRLTLAAKTRWGMAAYYAEGWRQWFTYSFPLFEVEFRVDGRLRRESVSQLLAIRVERCGGRLRCLAPGASLYRDDLRLVLMKSRRRWSYLRYVTGLQFNRAWLGKDVELVYSTELTCRLLPNVSGRILAEADGEVLSGLPINIAMTEATVNLLVPQGIRRRA